MSYSAEIKKIFIMAMESSYRKKEINEIITRIAGKMDKLMMEEGDLESLKREFESIRKDFNGTINHIK
ncbi:hypothetical protein THOM_0105 [Trachipleistophora hominis]|uniref:Uncharacterized protein n=1 Tax=Trachipleistophora hominis TaxID=72359 RepID=L7JZP2_TRAHO|nr:hypothetical protein THOM_0105 [Trachipleistophora hominis]